MPFSIIERAKGFVTSPVESFRQSREDKLIDAIRYFVVILTIFAIPSSFIVGTGNEIGFFIVYFLAGFIGLLAGSVSIHVLIGRTERFNQALKILAYSSTPAMLLGWIPVVGIIFGLWTIIILILGIREIYRISIVLAVIALFVSWLNAATISINLLLIIALFEASNDVLAILVFIAFTLILLALLDVGAYLYFKSRRKSSVDPHSPNPSLSMPSSSRQKHSKEEDSLFFYRSSTVSSQITSTPQRIETGLQKMKNAHPAWMDRPEFALSINNIRGNITDPSKYGDAERLYMQLESQIERIEQSIGDLDRLIGDLDQLRK